MGGGIAKAEPPGKGTAGPYRPASALNESGQIALYAPLCGEGVDRVRAIIAVLAGVIAVMTVVMLTGVKLDLAIAQWFYDPSRQRFLTAINPMIGAMRDNGMVALLTCAGFVIAAVVARVRGKSSQATSIRTVLFLVSTLALGPGLLVNGILKEHWHRPRPVHVTEFAGKENYAYVDWWNPGGSCSRNCSFVSGEAAAAAWMFAPAMLAPPQWRVAAYTGAAIFTAVISFVRMAAGGHFMTDVLFAVLFTLIMILALHRAIFGRQSTAPGAE